VDAKPLEPLGDSTVEASELAEGAGSHNRDPAEGASGALLLGHDPAQGRQ
jgi:hypothetical protein